LVVKCAQRHVTVTSDRGQLKCNDDDDNYDDNNDNNNNNNYWLNIVT